MFGFGKKKEGEGAAVQEVAAGADQLRFVAWLDRQPEQRRQVYLQLAMAYGFKHDIHNEETQEEVIP